MTETPEARLTAIQQELADERERLDRGDDGRLEPGAVGRLLDEAGKLTEAIEQQGITLTEAQYAEAAKRQDFAAYEYSRITTNEELLGKIEALREKGDVVGLYLLCSNMPPGALRTRAERSLLDTKALWTRLGRDAARIRECAYISPDKRREMHEYRQQLPQVTEDEVIERKKREYGGVGF
jgi:hypothetical protein